MNKTEIPSVAMWVVLPALPFFIHIGSLDSACQCILSNYTVDELAKKVQKWHLLYPLGIIDQ